jgi:hypothetical protein
MVSEYQPCASVFVVHEGMTVGEEHSDGHKYWKMKILSMHQGKDTIWIIGSWFYSPSDLKGLNLRKRCVI